MMTIIFWFPNIGLLLIQPSPPPVDALSDKSINTSNQLRIRRKIIPLSNDEYILFGYSLNYRYNKGKFTPLQMKTASSYDAVKVGDKIYFTTEDNGVHVYHISKNKVEIFTNSIFQKNLSTYGIGFGSKDSILLIGTKNSVIFKSLKTNEVKLIKMPINYSFMQTIIYDGVHEKLTEREKDVANGILEGLSYKMIAQKHEISIDTVRMNVKNIYKKLKINSKGELFNLAKK